MSKRDWMLTLLIIVIWGLNFTVVKIGLGSMPPMLLAAVRYVLVAFPAILFVKRPKIEWRYCLAYGFTIGLGQFSCLYYAIAIGMPAGLASVILQVQTFISLLLATLILKERLKRRQVIGMAVAVGGLVLVGLVMNPAGSKAIPLSALVLTVIAAFFWSLSTFVIKSASNRTKARGIQLNMTGMVVWSALTTPVPFLVLSLLMEGPIRIADALRGISLLTVVCILFMAWLSTLFGTGVWNHLLSRYAVSYLAPVTLLIPAAGLVIARIVLHEQLSTLQWVGSGIIILGLGIFNVGSGKSSEGIGDKG